MKINSLTTAVKELEQKLLGASDISYDGIDRLMRRIMKRHNLTAKELHYGFKDKHHKTPDDWIKMKRKLNEDHKEIQSGQRKDEEGYMARSELDIIDKAVKNLKKTIKSGDQQIPAWVQSKITKAADYIDTAADYLSSDEKVDESTIVDKILNDLFQEDCGCEEEKGALKGSKPVMSVEEIASKHKVSPSLIKKQLKAGIQVEKEHTTNREQAEAIALQHLAERPDYYTKLKKVESVQTESLIVTDLLGNPQFEFIDLIKPESIQEARKRGGTLHHWFKGSKSKDGKPGWVQADGSPCANEEGETKTPKCFSSGRLKALKKKGKKGKALIASAVRRKREQDPNQQGKTGASKPKNVRTFAKGKKHKHYVKPEPSLKESSELTEARRDRPGKGSGTKDACYHKVKSRFKVWPSAYACVPENSSKALTRDGWKTVDQLKIGDEILTYNLEKDELEFKPILNLHRYKDVKTNVVRSGNTGFIFECTDNHKWVMNIPYQKGAKFTKYEKTNSMFFMETLDLLERKTNKRMVVSAPYKGGQPLTKDLIYKYGDNWINYILEISEEQRQSWLFSSIIYDGNQHKIQRVKEKPELMEQKVWDHTSPYNKQTFGFKQKDIEHRDAFLLSAFLNQGLVTWKQQKNRDIYCCHYTSNKRYKNTSNFNLVKERVADVWCPETENSTWVMSQETDGRGIITITGNSASLVKCRKMGAANWGEAVEEQRYCKKCEKMETRNECSYGPETWDKMAIKMDEATLPVQNGQVMQILFSWRGKMMTSQLFFPQIRIPNRKEITDAIVKVYPDAKVLSYRVGSQNVGMPLIQIPNSKSKNYLLNNKTIGEDVEYLDEAGPSLSVGRGEKLSVSQGGGLTAKGRAKYNRATGSNLKAPVTGKVKTGSKAWKRRRNFCSRSRSWKGPRGLAARRRWKC